MRKRENRLLQAFIFVVGTTLTLAGCKKEPGRVLGPIFPDPMIETFYEEDVAGSWQVDSVVDGTWNSITGVSKRKVQIFNQGSTDQFWIELGKDRSYILSQLGGLKGGTYKYDHRSVHIPDINDGDRALLVNLNANELVFCYNLTEGKNEEIRSLYYSSKR